MKEQLIRDIRTQMSDCLSEEQLNRLHEVLLNCFDNVTMKIADESNYQHDNMDYLYMYISAKRIEGCSENTLSYYENTIRKMLNSIRKSIKNISTEDIRLYLSAYQEKQQANKVTMYSGSVVKTKI